MQAKSESSQTKQYPMLPKLIEIEVSNQDTFGREFYYPKNELTQTFCAIKKRKSLCLEDFVVLKNNGFDFIFTGDKSSMIDALFKTEQK